MEELGLIVNDKKPNIIKDKNFGFALKFFGKQDIKFGDKKFDKKYLIQSNEPGLITSILNIFRRLSLLLFQSQLFLPTLIRSLKAELKILQIWSKNIQLS